MQTTRNRRGEWEDVSQKYTSAQVSGVLDEIGIEVPGETHNDFLCFCPYHSNRDTPSFSVSRTSGTFICFNHACGVTGTLMDLVKYVSGRNDFEAMRLITKMGTTTQASFKDILAASLKPQEEMPEFSQALLDRMYDDFWNPETPAGREYMYSRGFTDETLREYKIGYSVRRSMVATPMHDVSGRPIGIIGRSADPQDKAFKNSTKLPTSKTLWNIHRAKRLGDTVIICEANFDAMRISQAGYPNVVACLGGNFSPYHIEQLDKHFSRIVIMTDFDDKTRHTYTGCRKCTGRGFRLCQGHNPGRALGETISEVMKRKNIQWASYERGIVYPPGVKDAGDMTDEQIRQCIKNSVSNFVYHTWNIER